MTPNFKMISDIFSCYISDQSTIPTYEDRIYQLVFLCMKINKEQWDLEDLARMVERGSDYIVSIKKDIDKSNQDRNNLVREIDTEIVSLLKVSPSTDDRFYSESPGMIIDRLTILFIRLSAIRELLSVIEESDIKKEYSEKEAIVLGQISQLGKFLDRYFVKLVNKEVFFEIQQPVKIYNDSRIRKYIKILK